MACFGQNFFGVLAVEGNVANPFFIIYDLCACFVIYVTSLPSYELFNVHVQLVYHFIVLNLFLKGNNRYYTFDLTTDNDIVVFHPRRACDSTFVLTHATKRK